MASKDGTIAAHRPKRGKRAHGSSVPYVNLDDDDLANEFLREPSPLQKKARTSNVPVDENTGPPSGCRVCGMDNKHDKLLLCESCNGEYHTFCLNPPLKSVPENEWFCDRCKQGDNLETMVSSLPESYTCRFGEIVWAHGGVGYGWWPACIYDPRLTLGAARMQAIKNLGKKHLVYFFECAEAPFEILPDHKILLWEQGIFEDCHLGKSAKASSKNRLAEFHCAVHAATIEENKPIDRRLDWNHQGGMAAQPQSPGSPIRQKEEQHAGKKRKAQARDSSPLRSGVGAASDRDGGVPRTISPKPKKQKKKRNSKGTHKGTQNSVDLGEDGEMYCKVFRSRDPGSSKKTTVGFVRTHSRLKSNFAQLRRVIENDLVPDAIEGDWEWRFLVPNLGPLSIKQEAKFGPALPFLRQASDSVGDGTVQSPVQVTLVDAPKPVV